ncbi:hypothetical protein MHYP_G00261970 [Metynnis hypsauchen]
MTQLLLFLSVSVYQTSAASHSLRYISTAITPGTHFPQYTVVGLVDGEPLMVYDSNIRKMIPKTECIEKRMGEDYWKEDTETFMREQKWSLSNMDTTMKRHNNTEGIHTWQWAYGCGGSSGELVGFLVGGIVAVLLLILICVGVFIWKKKQETETMETEMQETETQSLTETHHPTTPQSSG